MTFEEIIQQEEFGREAALLMVVSLSEAIQQLGAQSLVAELLPHRMEEALARFPQLNPLQIEACRALAQSLADHLDSLSPES